MAMVTLYHYSTKHYETGRPITQETDHYGRLTESQRRVEDELRAHSSEAAEKRATSVYAWESLEMAETGWCHKEGTHLYELEVDENDVRHVGDLDIFAAMATALTKNEPVDAFRRDYWAGKRTGKRIEILASKARVVRKLKDSSERLTPMQKAIRRQRESM
jgi:hypothetical protein